MKDLHQQDQVGDIGDTEKNEFHNEGLINSFNPDEQKRIVRRVDSRLVITVGCLFIVSLLDRTNLGAASVAG